MARPLLHDCKTKQILSYCFASKIGATVSRPQQPGGTMTSSVASESAAISQCRPFYAASVLVEGSVPGEGATGAFNSTCAEAPRNNTQSNVHARPAQAERMDQNCASTMTNMASKASMWDHQGSIWVEGVQLLHPPSPKVVLSF